MNTNVVPAIVRSHRIVRPKFDVIYPSVEVQNEPHVSYVINHRIMKELNRLIQEQYVTSTTEIVGGFEIKTNERNILSLTFSIYSYSGGAHGNTVLMSLTFELTNGHVFTLSELFKPNSNYEEVINRIIRRQIQERQLPLIEEFTGIKPNQGFYIADKSLVIFFQLYDLLPYAYGFTYFPISVYELQDIVIEDGALGRMIS